MPQPDLDVVLLSHSVQAVLGVSHAQPLAAAAWGSNRGRGGAGRSEHGAAPAGGTAGMQGWAHMHTGKPAPSRNPHIGYPAPSTHRSYHHTPSGQSLVEVQVTFWPSRVVA